MKPPKPSRHSVKLLETDPLLVVEVHLDGKGPFRFAVDTGASITVISSSTAREVRLRLPEAGTERAVSATGSAKATLLKLHSLRIGKMEIEDLQVAVMDLANLRRSAKLDLAGVIGRNLLARYRVTIDYRGSRIVFH
jgi:clan AA aspartic protease (TIGR02281 family)